jgi:hypothetical protein
MFWEAANEVVKIYGGAGRARSQAGGTGVPVEELLGKYGISRATFYDWRKKSGLEASKMKRLRGLEAESKRPKGLVADLALDMLHW